MFVTSFEVQCPCTRNLSYPKKVFCTFSLCANVRPRFAKFCAVGFNPAEPPASTARVRSKGLDEESSDGDGQTGTGEGGGSTSSDDALSSRRSILGSLGSGGSISVGALGGRRGLGAVVAVARGGDGGARSDTGRSGGAGDGASGGRDALVVAAGSGAGLSGALRELALHVGEDLGEVGNLVTTLAAGGELGGDGGHESVDISGW